MSDCLAGAANIDPSNFPACTPACAGAHCVPASLIGSVANSSELTQLADCGDNGKCVPDPFIRRAGKFVAASCQSLLGAEGRCLSTCLGAVQAQASRLPQDSCSEGEVCAPCYDPTSGERTGACELSCDPGPQEEPKVFDKCCNDLGLCVPENVVPAGQADLLGADTCAANSLCAPAMLVSSTSRPPSCRSVGDGEGRCLPACLPSLGSVSGFLPRGSCAEGMLCAPCYDPRTGDPSGACTLNGDSPQEDAYTFPKCCGGDGGPTLGTCIPLAAVPASFASLLSQDTCPDATMVCAPDLKVQDINAKFPACTTTAFCDEDGGGCWPGACLPACLLPAEYQGAPQQTCAVGEICTPCNHPLQDGAPTGACD